jgi:hypothetical protein
MIFDVFHVPSGKLSHNELERSTIFNGKIHYFYGHGFNSYVDITRGYPNPKILWWIPWNFQEIPGMEMNPCVFTDTGRPDISGIKQRTSPGGASISSYIIFRKSTLLIFIVLSHEKKHEISSKP